MVVLNKKSASNMKKLVFALVLLPFFSKAQFVQSFYQFYTNPMSQFFLDTSMYHAGNWQAKKYNVDKDGYHKLANKYFWKSNGPKMVEWVNSVYSETGISYYRSEFEYSSNVPNKIKRFQQLAGQANEAAGGFDSLIYENNLLKYFVKSGASGYSLEYFYDSVNGINKSDKHNFPIPIVVHGLFEVKEFYKPNLPKIIHGYSQSQTEKSLIGISYYYYDSLDRVVLALDSTYFFSDILERVRSVTYVGKTNLPDSIKVNNLKSSYNEIQVLKYDSLSKVSQILRFRDDGISSNSLVEKIEFINPANGTHEELKEAANLFVYPNPASNLIYLKSNEDIVRVKIFNLKGSLVLDISQEKIEEVEVSKFAEGAYFMILQTRLGHVEYQKFFKEN